MDYNSSREELIIPEYGRNVQKMIQYAKQIEDAEERQVFAERIVQLMMQMHPQNRNMEDNREKLWKHVFMIAEFDIDVMPPNGVRPDPSDTINRPDVVEYPKSEAKFRHYGNNVQKLVDKALAMDDPEKKEGFAHVIGSYMKLAYRTWNREHFVSDEVIKNDLESLSDGALKMDENTVIESLMPHNSNNNNNRRRNSNKRSNNDRGGKGRSKNYRKKK